MNKINSTIFSQGNFTLNISIRLTDANLSPFSKPFKMQNGYIVFNYEPKKAFVIKDRKSKDEAYFQLETIYELRDMLTFIYVGMSKKDMFFKDELGALVPNNDEIKKHTVELKNKFNRIRMRPDFRVIDFQDIEGISFMLEKGNIFLEHSSCKLLIKLLNATDILTYAESLLTNAILTGREK